MAASDIRRVGIIFSGGPAPGANAVIAASAGSFLEDGRIVLGFFFGYSNLQAYHPASHPLVPDEHFRIFDERDLRGLRNQRGIVIGTSRANPGKGIEGPGDLREEAKTRRLRAVYDAFVDLDLDALISIGGDDTLKTANKFKLYQEKLPPGALRIPVVHLPKTIDNDYRGIDFTFGYFTAVDFLVLDNIDQRSKEFQDEVFVIAQGLSSLLPATVFVSLRPATFFDSKLRGSLAAYQPRAFHVSPARVANP